MTEGASSQGEDRAVVNGAGQAVSAVPASVPSADQQSLSAWSERRPERTESERAAIAARLASHLPPLPPSHFLSNEDIDALKAAFIRRFDEDLPRTETLFAVASIGYRMALRDMAQGAAA